MSAVTVRRLQVGDEREVARFDEAFDNTVDPSLADTFLRDERHHLVVAYVNDRAAGFVSATQVFHPDKQPELFLNEISVIERFRRAGAATALIDELKAIGRELGCASIWVLTDEGNEPAMALYRKTGGQWTGQHSVMFEYLLPRG